LASEIDLMRIPKGDCTAEADDEVPVSEPGHQDAVRPSPLGTLDHPLDGRSNAAVQGGPVVDLYFYVFHILHIHDLLTLLGRIGLTVYPCAFHAGLEVRRRRIFARERPQ
jgi:hypothetical protein